MRVQQSKKKFVAAELARDLTCAFAAGLCAGSFTFIIYLLKPHGFNISTFLKFMLMALVAYVAVALILNKVWARGLRRMVPNWILISVFGSTLFVMLRLLPAVIVGWSGPTVTEPSLATYLTAEIDAARSVVIVLSVITLPITALLYYTNSILRALSRWHNGPELPPRISPP